MNQTLTQQLVRELLEGADTLPDANFGAPWASKVPPNTTRKGNYTTTDEILLPARIGASMANAEGRHSFQTYSILVGMMAAIVLYSLWKLGELNK